MEPVQPILDRRKLLFRNIWSLDAQGGGIAWLFKDQMAAAFPVCSVATVASAEAKHMANEDNPAALDVLLKQAIEGQ